MVDLTNRVSSLKVQRSLYLDDPTSERLDRAVALGGGNRSQIVSDLIWNDLKLPGDNPTDPNQTVLDLGDIPAAAPQPNDDEEDIDID